MSEKTWSDHRSRFLMGLAAGVVLAVVFATALTQGARAGGEIKKRTRHLIRESTDTYDIVQADRQVGRETVTRSEFDDNTTRFEARTEMQMSHGAKVETDNDLLLEEDSHFPLKFKMKRVVRQENMEVEQTMDIDMVSNVAVIRAVTNENEVVSRKILPTGTAIIDMMTAHQYYQPLYWYNRDSGGVQVFNVLDPLLKKEYSATMRFQQEETIEIDGKPVAASRFEYTREKLTAHLWVDANDRIVKVEQGFMIFTLTTDAE